jgi:hypothetical protein
MAEMDSSRRRLAIAQLTARLTTDYDLMALLETIAENARVCFDAYSAVVVLVFYRHPDAPAEVEIIAEAIRDDLPADRSFHTTGPGLASARDGAVTMMADLTDVDDTRWPGYRDSAVSAGMRGVRAFPVTALGVSLGSVIVHTDEPWGTSRPNDFGQILANLTSIALSNGGVDTRRTHSTEAIHAVLEGVIALSTATGILAEVLSLDVADARPTLMRLARAHGYTVTEHARAIINAQNEFLRNPASSGVFHPPPDLTPQRQIDA